MNHEMSFAGIARLIVFVAAAIALLPSANADADADDAPFLPRIITSSTIPANGDLNPYGVAFVPAGFPDGGAIAPGDVLVSNFNNAQNLQGGGTTIVKLTPNGVIASASTPGQPPGSATTFFQSPLAGLSTALGVLRGGFVLVGNVPTKDGTFGTLGTGALQVIDRNGNRVQTITNPLLDTPWDLTIDDHGATAQIYVSNVVSGNIVRVDVAVGGTAVRVVQITKIATGYLADVPNAAALILGPTGLAFDEGTGVLFVASTADNAVFAVANAAQATRAVIKGRLVFADPHLRGPLGLTLAANRRLLTANGDAVNADPTHPSEIVEFTRDGIFVRESNVDSAEGGAFGLATAQSDDFEFDFAAVDDVSNNILVYGLHTRPSFVVDER
jgi:hypothetical protein